MNTILVYGFYGKSNLGDNLFMEAFQKLFPDFRFIFTDNIKEIDLEYISTVFIGGGSFLNMQPNITSGALKLLLSKKIFYIGVGAETDIHSTHLQLISKAKLIAIRSQNINDLKKINPNTICIPDLVYALQDDIQLSNSICHSVLVLPNICVVPNCNDIYWKHAAWNHFKTEFAQFLDYLIEQQYSINLFPMCQNDLQHDSGAALEIINMMNYRSNEYLITDMKSEIKSITSFMSRYNRVITQRYHGAILSNMIGIPSLSIYHHDKLKNDNSISFYEISKDCLIKQFNSLNTSNILPLNQDIFKPLQQTVINLI
jgi:polysaccharide pyruvyl transferase WcaK-like protein